MTQRTGIEKEETYVYNIPDRVLDTLQLMYFDSSTTEEILPQDALKISSNDQIRSVDSHTTTTEKSRDYYKSDLYKLNIKREARGLPKLSEEEFDEFANDLNESISGSEASDSESEDEGRVFERKRDKLETIFEKSVQKLEELNIEESDSIVSHLTNRSPYILFKSSLLEDDKCFGIYKSLFKIDEIENPVNTLKSWKNNGLARKSALLMIGGGHFAGAIISHKPKSTKGNVVKAGDSILEQSVDVLAHKSFHRYTTRRKQGGSQSASDNARGKANSAGSSLRRQNEAALTLEVRELLKSWKSHFDECDSIFIRANGASNRGILVGYEGSVLKNDDVRIKSFPFTTKRATTTELKRAWVQLSYLTITNRPKIDDKKLKEKAAQEQLKQSTLQATTKVDKVISPDEKHTIELVNFLKKSRGPVLITYLKKHKLSPNFTLQPESEYFITPTLLHYASAHGIKNLISTLIKIAKVDPTLKNSNGKTAYEVAANKQVRQAFRTTRHELGEDFVSWDDAKVGSAISREEVEAEEKSVKDEEEREKKRLIQQELEKKSAIVSTAQKSVRLSGIPVSQANLNTLSDEQRMRLMREQRARAAEARFKQQQVPQ